MTEFNTKNPILIDIPMPIVTDRLIIRETRFGDGEAIHEGKEESFAEINKWMNWAKTRSTIEEDEIVAREAHIRFLKKEDLTLYTFGKETGKFLGGTGLHRFDWEHRIIEIGYWYRTSATGQGYATEGTKALIKYAFNVLNAKKVIIVVSEGNDASRRVIEKAGFHFEYTVHDEDVLPDGSITDKHWYSLYNADHLNDFNVTWGMTP
jgi:ribosomal-protein-serine acetyltransferase